MNGAIRWAADHGFNVTDISGSKLLLITFSRLSALFLGLVGGTIAYGAAMEFAYFGPGTPQFIAGLVATPAGLLMVIAAASLWMAHRRTRAITMIAGMFMLIATAIATYLDVMGPPATILGIVGGLVALIAAKE